MSRCLHHHWFLSPALLHPHVHVFSPSPPRSNCLACVRSESLQSVWFIKLLVFEFNWIWPFGCVFLRYTIKFMTKRLPHVGLHTNQFLQSLNDSLQQWYIISIFFNWSNFLARRRRRLARNKSGFVVSHQRLSYNLFLTQLSPSNQFFSLTTFPWWKRRETNKEATALS